MSQPSLTLPRADLLAALARPAAVVQAMVKAKGRERIELNPRNCVWLSAAENGLRIQGSDEAVDVVGVAPGAIPTGEIACGVAGRKFLELAGRLPEGPVTLSLDAAGDRLSIKAGRSRAHLAVKDVKYRPQVEPLFREDMRPLDGKRFAAAVAAVAPSAGDEHPMDQIRFTPGRDGLRIEAFCGPEFVRLALPTPGAAPAEPATAWAGIFDVPCGTDARRLYGLHKWIETAELVGVTEKRLHFAGAGTRWSVPVRRGEFMPTDRLLEHLAGHAPTLDVETESFLAAAERLSLYLAEGDKKMCLEVGPAGAWLCLDGARGIEPLSEAALPEPVRLLIPGVEFGRFLRRAPSPRVRLTLTGQRSPVGVHALDEVGHVRPGYVGVVMPFVTAMDAYVSVEEAA